MKYTLIVSNCLSNEIARLFKGDIQERVVLEKNKILFVIKPENVSLMEYILKRRNIKFSKGE